MSAAGTVCRPAAGPCDAAETCSGTGGACPPDVLSSAGTVCRPAAGGCDVAETCTGGTNACPPDVKLPAGTVCRPAAGVCDVAELCDGTSGNCPANRVFTATVQCRPAAGGCDVAEFCPGTGGLCPPDNTGDLDGDGVCDAQDNCPATPNPDQSDLNGNGIGDACEPCTNLAGVFMTDARVVIGRLNTPPGDDRLLFQGQMVVPYPYSPPLDPLANGLRVLVTDVTGAAVLDATIPGGAFDPTTAAGWTVDSGGTTWRYKNAAGTILGIRRVLLRDISNAVGNTVRGRLRFVVMGRSGSYQTDASKMPLRGMVVLDPPTAATGECGEAVFPGPPGGTCVFNSVGSMLRCR